MIIRAKDKQTIENIANDTFSTPCQIIAYGSRVDGSAHDASDLDIVIRAKSGYVVDSREFMDFKNKVQDSNIPIIVQILNWQNIPEDFKSNILKNHCVLINIQT
ncbi:nucleotidyltransferase family protein [Francisella philomiragia]|uniref:nucleotidyltransferase family protein n=1 Tax=Francisella philomiragia TaxID=28110 RepID=UPI003516A890